MKEQRNIEIVVTERNNGEIPFKRSVSKQIILGLITNFSNIAPSMSLGFSAIALPVLTTDTHHPLSTEQSSWFASIASLATPFGCLFSGPITDKFGRKTALFTTNTICLIGWAIIAAALTLLRSGDQYRYPLLLIGRFLTGLSTGLASMPATIYVSEISSAKLRSVFCTWSTISFGIGVLVVYMLGWWLKEAIGTIAVITVFLPCAGILMTAWFVPESPTWLVAKNRYDDARRNMCRIFGTNDHDYVQKELTSLIACKKVKASGKRRKTLIEKCVKKIKMLMKPSCLKPFGLILAYFFFQQFAGTYVLVFYAHDIVQEAGVQIDPYLTIVMIAITRLLTSIAVSVISHKVGRRPLSILSGCGMTASMVALSFYLILVDRGIVSSPLPIPLLLLLLYFLTSTFGFLPMPFAISSEVFAANVRGTASGLITCFAYFFNFITVKMYSTMIHGLGRAGVFLFYGVVALIGTIFVAVLLPETRGKTLAEIQEYFVGSSAVKRTDQSDNDDDNLTSDCVNKVPDQMC